MGQAQPVGQRMDQARARFRRAVEAGEKAQEATLKAHANFVQAEQDVVLAQMDLHKGHAGSPIASDASPTSQRDLGQIFGSFDRTYRKHVESRGRTTTRPTGSRNPRVEGNSSDLTIDPVPGRRRSHGGRDGRRAGPRALGPGRGRSRRDGRLRGGARCRRAELRQTRKAAAEREPPTPPQQKTRTTELEALANGSAPLSQVQFLTSHAESQGHGTRHAFATSTRANPSLGDKFLKFCSLVICTAACFCPHARPGRRWPTCFDQTCGYPGEGPLTTLDSPEEPEPSLIQTQELRRVSW